MEFIDKLKAISERIEKQLGNVGTEEAAKTAFIMPFIQALGYDVFDPTEVVPEFTADIGTKKGEKVDYCVMVDGKPAILFECKWQGGGEIRDQHMSQLYRYFSVTTARIGVLTNGITYRFYSDIEEPNKMDSRPFLVLDMRNLSEPLVAELARITKQSFDLDEMLSAAGELKYVREVKGILQAESEAPSEDFVRFFFARAAPGRRLTENVREQFASIVKRAMAQLIKEHIDRRLENALSAGAAGSAAPTGEASGVSEPPKELDTTEEELEGYFIVKSILRDHVDADRIVYRDAKTYFAVLLDDNNRRPICRLWLNGARKKYVSLFDENRVELKVQIHQVQDLYGHAQVIQATVACYLEAKDTASSKVLAGAAE